MTIRYSPSRPNWIITSSVKPCMTPSGSWVSLLWDSKSIQYVMSQLPPFTCSSILHSDLLWWQGLSFFHLCIYPSCWNSIHHIIDKLFAEWTKEDINKWKVKLSNCIGFTQYFLASLRDITRQYMINCWMNCIPGIAIEIRRSLIHLCISPRAPSKVTCS